MTTMYIDIQFFCLITAICILTNLNFVHTMKFFHRSSKVEKFISIEKPRLRIYDGRINMEAEISLLTKSLGFIVCDQQQLPFMKNFVHHYISIKEGHTVKPKRIKRKHFLKANLEDKIERCKRYLHDDVLRDNLIFLADDPSWLEEIKIEEKEIHFDYYQREPETVKAIVCPVMMRNRLQMLYIAGTGRVENTDQMQYFVMVERSPNENSRLSILMRTIEQSNPEINDAEIGKAEPELIAENPDRCAIQLTVRRHWNKDDFRLFGKEAERAYITTDYGFINLTYNQDIIDHFVELVENLKKVYKIKNTISKHSLDDLSKEEKWQLCNVYIDNSSLLSKLPVVAVSNQEGSEYKIKVKPTEIQYQQFVTSSEIHEFLNCPIVYVTNTSEQNKITLHVMPVWFEDENRCGKYSFLKLHVPPDAETEENELLLYSKLEEKKASNNFYEENGNADHLEDNGEIATDLALATAATAPLYTEEEQETHTNESNTCDEEVEFDI